MTRRSAEPAGAGRAGLVAAARPRPDPAGVGLRLGARRLRRGGAGAAGAAHGGRLPRGHRDLPLDANGRAGCSTRSSSTGCSSCVEAVVAGLLVGIQNFWILGGAVYLGGRAADGAATYRQARHVTGLATTPFVLSLLFVWPVRIAMFGKDAFQSGGSDHGAAEDVFRRLRRRVRAVGDRAARRSASAR